MISMLVGLIFILVGYVGLFGVCMLVIGLANHSEEWYDRIGFGRWIAWGVLGVGILTHFEEGGATEIFYIGNDVLTPYIHILMNPNDDGSAFLGLLYSVGPFIAFAICHVIWDSLDGSPDTVIGWITAAISGIAGIGMMYSLYCIFTMSLVGGTPESNANFGNGSGCYTAHYTPAEYLEVQKAWKSEGNPPNEYEKCVEGEDESEFIIEPI